ncbi:MAG: ROK family protein [Clostridia bacterium]|nr:ROK family protein [Clostridia bacterium]
MANSKKYYVGIDIGGTFIKGGVVTEKGEIIYSNKIKTEVEKGNDKIVENINTLINMLLEKSNTNKQNVIGVGIGVPGTIDSEKGIVVCAHNLKFYNFEIVDKLKVLSKLEVKIENDANLALIGETMFGAAKGCSEVVMITLGTGVGGGAIVKGKLLEGNKSAGAEFGHSVLVVDGNQCSCGRKGCFEAYSSATALINKTKELMEQNKNSKMWEVGSIKNVDGETVFKYVKTDKTAQQVLNWYLKYLACGVVNYANVFRPQIFVVGGGIANQGEVIIKPLNDYMKKDLFASGMSPDVKVVAATLGNNAGVLGSVGLYKGLR